MKGKAVSGIMLTVFLISVLGMALNVQPATAEPKTWTVDDDGPADFPTIQEAVNAANLGDTIYVYNGTYYEHVVLNKTVTLVGENRSITIIDGSRVGKVVHITADNVVIRGFTVKRGLWGIVLDSCRNNTVSGNIVANNDYGVSLSRSSNNTVSGNIIANNGWEAVSFYESSNNTVSGNIVTYNGDGIIMGPKSSNNTVSGNTVTYNGDGISLSGSNNTVSWNIVTYNGDGIILSGSDNTVSWNTVTYDGGGVVLSGGWNHTVYGNNVANNFYGVIISGGWNHTVYGNNITSSSLYGIYLSYSNDNRIYGNNITSSSLYGVMIYSSSSNKFYHNNFINNAQHVWSDSTNVWDHGYPSGGNYWTDYNSTDYYNGPYQNETGSDGIGDTPYVIDANNTDMYPLKNPYPSHDIAINGIKLSKNIVGQGFTLEIDADVINQGDFNETAIIVINFNSTPIANLSLPLPIREPTTIYFTWNTSGFAKGNYTISAIADIVPGEIDIADNNFTAGWVVVAMVGDITGPDGWPDGKVDIRDIAVVARLFGVNYPDPSYNANYDIVHDGKIDIRDIAIAARHFGETN